MTSPMAVAEREIGPIQDARLRSLVAHWLEIREPRLMPRRQDLDPTAIPSALPIIWLLDFLPEEDRFRYRLAGEQINAIFGGNLAGKFLDEVMTARAHRIVHRHLMKVVEEHLISHCTGLVYLRQDRTAVGERIILPLSEDGAEGTGVVGATAYDTNGGSGRYWHERFLTERYIRISPAGTEPVDGDRKI